MLLKVLSQRGQSSGRDGGDCCVCRPARDFFNAGSSSLDDDALGLAGERTRFNGVRATRGFFGGLGSSADGERDLLERTESFPPQRC